MSEPWCTAVGPCVLAAAIDKHAKNALSFLVANLVFCFSIALIGGGLQFGERRLQNRARREDDRALNEVLQFADVARPLPAHQSFHGSRGNAGDGLSHLTGELADE